MESKLFGFLLDEDIQLDIANKRLVCYRAETSEDAMYFKVVTLNDIQLRLLLLLLGSEPGDVISKNDIINSIWEESLTHPSDQRLWYLIKVLRSKLASIGMSESFISNAHGVGYFLKGHEVSPIFLG
ncbi:MULTISPECIES: helix-turn-helix domain-containing protein [unclassified Serratia (in: enterobacteria)]|uniref:winged helix-turn-helix domain-containing protein n=1 Tax=unclassified Serratia (in: enterobacteria) TaxID=2647522 RepID=UPI001268D996|nr:MULTISPECIES: helix-turn-helix domain-containing protein [unclassified Serratia (in: enterobacteria)]